MKNRKMDRKTRKIPQHLKKRIIKIKRRERHPLIHHVHKKYSISRKTLFYMKEYGPKSHIATVIVNESFKILVLASLISSIGGLGLQSIHNILLITTPLLILLPALNDMIGDYGTIISSKFSTMLYLGKIRGRRGEKNLRGLLKLVMIIALISAVYIGILSVVISYFKGFPINFVVFSKVLFISIFSVLILVGLIFLISITLGFYVFRKKEDPNNFLIPITTSIADLGSMVIFSLMVMSFF